MQGEFECEPPTTSLSFHGEDAVVFSSVTIGCPYCDLPHQYLPDAVRVAWSDQHLTYTLAAACLTLSGVDFLVAIEPEVYTAISELQADPLGPLSLQILEEFRAGFDNERWFEELLS